VTRVTDLVACLAVANGSGRLMPELVHRPTVLRYLRVSGAKGGVLPSCRLRRNWLPH
jgi:hypothetical protein